MRNEAALQSIETMLNAAQIGMNLPLEERVGLLLVRVMNAEEEVEMLNRAVRISSQNFENMRSLNNDLIKQLKDKNV